MSIDPVTDELRRKFDHPFASRPLGDIDEDAMPSRHVYELSDTIRLAVEENGRRAKKATTRLLRDANLLCLEFWRDVARLGIHFGYPPRTHIVLSRMWDWQLARMHLRLQRRPNSMAQGEMRDTLETCWCSLVPPNDPVLGRSRSPGHNILYVANGRGWKDRPVAM